MSDHHKIDFSSIPWQTPAYGARQKVHKQGGRQVRLVEFTDEFIEKDWCTKGHIVYILEGRLEVNFSGNVVVVGKGDGLLIPAGEKDKHKGRALTKVVKMLFVEDVSPEA